MNCPTCKVPREDFMLFGCQSFERVELGQDCPWGVSFVEEFREIDPDVWRKLIDANRKSVGLYPHPLIVAHDAIHPSFVEMEGGTLITIDDVPRARDYLRSAALWGDVVAKIDPPRDQFVIEARPTYTIPEIQKPRNRHERRKFNSKRYKGD